MYEQGYRFGQNTVKQIQSQLRNRAVMEDLARGFVYQDELNLSNNLLSLSESVARQMGLNTKAAKSLRIFLQDKNIPIEVTFKPLKASQLIDLLEKWMTQEPQESNQERILSNNIRNLMFRRLLFEEKQTIDDHFEILSKRNMLPAINLFNLLQDITSSYFLYEHTNDSQTFFMKTNSLQNFLAIVEKYLHSDKRAVHSSEEEFNLVRRWQFEKLIEFWESQNEELTLLSEQRKSLIFQQVQTQSFAMHETSSQTDRGINGLLQIINSSIETFNQMANHGTQIQIEAVERICACLRRQKIELLQNKKNRQGKLEIILTSADRQPKKNIFEENNFNENSQLNLTIRKVDDKNIHLQTLISPTQQLLFPTPSHIITQPLEDVLSAIFEKYQISHQITIRQFQKFWTSLALLHRDIKIDVNELQTSGIISRKSMDYWQFQAVITKIMQLDHHITNEMLQNFIKSIHSRTQSPSPTKIDSTCKLSSERQSRSRNFVGKYLETTRRQ